MNGKEMCEFIAGTRLLSRPDGSEPTAKEIWEYSPSGELYQVFFWFAEAAAAFLGCWMIVAGSMRSDWNDSIRTWMLAWAGGESGE